MKKTFLLLAASIIGSQLSAQDSSTSKQLDEVIISANRLEQKQSQTGKVVTVIDKATLQRHAGKTLSEIMNLQAGVFINGANNNFGTNQDFYLRGAATGYTLILIDGVPVSDASLINNSFDLNSINPAQVERIEILKGAQSTLWGSDAVAGVINIITKKAGSKKLEGNGSLNYGSYHTVKANAGVGGKLNQFTYNVNYNFTDSKGFSAAQDTLGTLNFDRDGFTQNNFQANLAFRLTPAFTVKTLSGYSKYKAGADAGAFTDDKDYTFENTNVINSLVLAYKIKNTSLQFSNTLIDAKRIILNDSTSANGNKDFYSGKYKGRSFVSELFGSFTLSNKLSLVSGIQRTAQLTNQENNGYASAWLYTYSSKLSSDSAKATSYAVYASLIFGNWHGFNAEAGFRYNNHSIYGNNTTYSFNPSYHIDDNTRVFVNISSGYKIPSLYQLYSEYGNKDLKPEDSRNYEIGVQSFSNNRKNSFRIVGFKRNIKNLLVFYTDMNTYESRYINRDEQHDYGFELESSIGIGSKGSWSNNFTYVDGEGKTNTKKVKNLYRRPNFTFNSALTLEVAKDLTVMPSFRFIGTRLKGEYDPGSAQMPSYYTIDCYFGYQFSKNIKAFVDLRNITNQVYFDVPGYNSRKFNFNTGIGFVL